MKPTLFCLVVSACSGCTSYPANIPEEDGLVAYSFNYPVVSRFLESSTGAPLGSVISYQRDSSGAKLYISYHLRNGQKPAYQTLTVNGTQISTTSSYPWVWYDDDGQPIFRIEGFNEWYGWGQ